MCIFGTKSRWIYIIFIPPWIRCKSILVLFRKIFLYYVHTHGNKNEYLPIQKLKYGYLFFNYGFSLFQAHHYIHIYETFKIYLDYDSFTFKRNYMKPIHFLGAGNGSHRSANRPAQQHVLIWRIRDAILVWAMSDYNTKYPESGTVGGEYIVPCTLRTSFLDLNELFVVKMYYWWDVQINDRGPHTQKNQFPSAIFNL